MQGYISTREVLLHPRMIVESFGLRVYMRCLVRMACFSHQRPVTFLECI